MVSVCSSDALSSSRYDITCGLSKFAKSFTADYCIMIAHLTSNSFEGNSCRHKPIICHLCDSIICLNELKFPNLKRGHTEFWIMNGMHDSRAWYLDIVLIRHTCMIISFQWNICLVQIDICILN